MTLVSPKDLHRIEQHLGDRLDECLDAGAAGPGLVALNDRLRGYVLRGGKRIRPQLCLWAFGSLGGDPPAPALLDVACAWEIFHAFLLVHDDLIDAADTRRQTPSLHRQLQNLDHDSDQFGQNLAIIAGDLLFGVALRLVADAAAPAAVRIELLRLFTRIACTTGYGQAIDLFQAQVPLARVREDELLREYNWKTAAYTFEGPMLSGAILAGADAATLTTLATVARAIGQAYQLQNDLTDLAAPAHEGCDLVQGKRTVTLMRARSTMCAPQRQAFDARLAALATANGDAVRLAEQLRQEVNDSGAIDQTSGLIEELLSDARSAAVTLAGRLGDAVPALIDGLESAYFRTCAQAGV